MNLTIPAIFIILLILPGIVFRKIYLSRPYFKKSEKVLSNEDVAWTIVAAAFLHLTLVVVIYFFTPYRIDFEILSNLTNPNPSVKRNVIHNIETNFRMIAL